MIGSHSYAKVIPRREREALEAALDMGGGYVLDFSDRTFDEFIYEAVGIDPAEKANLFAAYGTSKAKRLRSFIERAEPAVVGKLLRELWDYREEMTTPSPPGWEETRERYFSAVARIEGRSDAIDTTEIEAFEPGETLEELVSAIRRDLDAKKPQAALDRLHTYCMKRFAALIQRHGGGECGKDDPLHSRVARYLKLLREHREMTTMSERVLKSAIGTFEAMNWVRNDQSFAHDNPNLVQMDEARFIFDSVTAVLRYAKAVDGQRFED